MAAQLFIVTPASADPDGFPKTLMAVLGAASVAAILVQRGERSEADYTRLAQAIVNVGQGAGCAVLVEDDAALAKRLGADGVHVSGDAMAIKAAVKALKPSLIVGAGNIGSRHDAMTAGELDVDYLFFGPVAGPFDAAAEDLALWWSETFEIPAVLSDPAATPQTAQTAAVEFIALSDSLWTAQPAATAAGFAQAMEPV
ncbi:thiamine phosphate synthase [uncultured Devosia sp.]|uniref:thiamine phosphate synthase n=1 Tax=uncultured Devosia sp. TaxID=211434 RepID=UPI0035CA661C